MVELIRQQSGFIDSTVLWRALDRVSEALSNMLGLASHWLGAELDGNQSNSTLVPKGNYTETVSTLISPLGVGWVLVVVSHWRINKIFRRGGNSKVCIQSKHSQYTHRSVVAGANDRGYLESF